MQRRASARENEPMVYIGHLSWKFGNAWKNLAGQASWHPLNPSGTSTLHSLLIAWDVVWKPCLSLLSEPFPFWEQNFFWYYHASSSWTEQEFRNWHVTAWRVHWQIDLKARRGHSDSSYEMKQNWDKQKMEVKRQREMREMEIEPEVLLRERQRFS